MAIEKSLGPLLVGHAIKQDKLSLKWTVDQIKAVRPSALYDKLLAIGALYVDKGSSVSLMLLRTVNDAPMPVRVAKGKREREVTASAPLQRGAPEVANVLDVHDTPAPTRAPDAPRQQRNVPRVIEDDSDAFANTLAQQSKKGE